MSITSRKTILSILLSGGMFLIACKGWAQVVAGPDQTICEGDTTQLTATGGSNYLWTSTPYDPTMSDSTIANPTVSPDVDTYYEVESREVGVNIVMNGSFELGNMGFSSSYTYCNTPNCLWPEATYGVHEDPSYLHNNFAACGDHTTGNGKMMIVNGAGTPGVIVWNQTITNITPNTDYEFSTWVTSVVASSPAILQFRINGVLLGTPFQATPITCNWRQFFEVWNSGASTTADISIINQNTATSGNDFALDDISFAEVTYSTDDTWVYVEQEPTSGFYMPEEACAYDTVVITHTGIASPNAVFHWDFGGAVIVGGSGPETWEVIWENPGNPMVSLWIEGEACISATTQNSIVINALPEVELTADQTSIPFGTSTTLHGVVSGNPGPVNYVWSPENLLVDPFTLDPQTVLLTQTTTFFLTAADEVTGCDTTAEISINITGGPLQILDLYADPEEICLNESSTLHLTVSGGSGDYTANWFSDPPGFTYSGEELDIPVTPTDTTTYFVWVNDGFSDSDTMNVTVFIKPSPSISLQPLGLNVLEGDTAVFSIEALDFLSYQWEESTDNGSNWLLLSDNATYQGTQTAVLMVLNTNLQMDGNIYRCVVSGDCDPDAVSNEALLIVRDEITVVTGFENNYHCINNGVVVPLLIENFTDIIDFELSFSFNESVLEFVSISNVYPSIGGDLSFEMLDGEVTLSWTSTTPVSLSGNKLLDVEFTGLESINTQLEWNLPYCIFHNSYNETLPVQFSDGMLDLLTIPDSAGLIHGPDSLCFGETQVVYQTDPITHADEYVWNVPQGWNIVSGLGTNEISIEIDNAGTQPEIEVFGRNVCGSGNASELDIVIIPLPESPLDLSANPDYLFAGDNMQVNLYSTGGLGDTLLWYSGDCVNGSLIGGGVNLTIQQPVQTTTYFAKWINNCGESSCKEVTVFIDQKLLLFAPNAFTPNNDGLNDVFTVLTPNLFSEFNLYVFDKWGQVIFESNDKDHGWDGNVNGSPAPAGTYVWVVEFKIGAVGIEKNVEKKRGVVSLIR